MEKLEDRISELRNILKYMHELALGYRDKAIALAKSEAQMTKSDSEKTSLIQELHASLNDKTAEIASLKAGNASLANTKERLEKENSELLLKISGLDRQYKELAASASAQASDLEERFRALRSVEKIGELVRIRSEWQDGIEKNKLEADRLKRERHSLEKDKSDFEDDKAAVADKERTLKTQEEALNEKRQRLDAEIKKQQELAGDYQRKIFALDKEKEDLEKVRTEQEKLAGDYRQKLQELELERETLAAATADQQRLAGEWRLKMRTLEDERASFAPNTDGQAALAAERLQKIQEQEKVDKALNDGLVEIVQAKTEVPDSGAEKPEAHADQQKNSFGNEEKESTKASETEGSGHASSGLETRESAIEPMGADNIVNNKEKTGCEAGAYPENKGIFRKSASHSVYEDMLEEDFSASRSVASPLHNGQLSASDTVPGASMYETLLSSDTDLSPDDDKAETTRHNPQSGPNAVNNETDQTGGGR